MRPLGFNRAERQRLRRIVATLARHGLGWLVLELGLGRLLPFHRGLLEHARRAEPYTKPEHVRLALEDLAILHELAYLSARRTAWGRSYDLEGWMHEFAFTFRNEFDYSVEAARAEQFRRHFAGEPALYVPAVHWAYTTRRILTLERIEGIKITDLDALDRAGIDRRQLARDATRILLTMLFEHGFFHADPHPGNLFVLPGGVIGLIDFGMVGQLDAALREALLRVVLALIAPDADRLVDELLALGIGLLWSVWRSGRF